MITLMTYSGQGGVDALVTRTGGTPLTPLGYEWPRCGECRGFMQFLAQVRIDDVEPDTAGLLSIFMCQNDPGLCDEWDPVAGGNRALVFGMDAVETPVVPDEDATLLAEASAVAFVTVEADDYFEAREGWSRETGRSVLEVLGHVGGQPAWLQNDETPALRNV